MSLSVVGSCGRVLVGGIMFSFGSAITAMLSSMLSRGVGDACLLDGSTGIVVDTSPRLVSMLLGDCSLTMVCGADCRLCGWVAVYLGGASLGVYGGAFMFISGYSEEGWVIDGSSVW